MNLGKRFWWRGSVMAVLMLVVATTVSAAILSIPFFSQRDSAWSGQKMNGTTTTLDDKGCATTSMAMLLRFRGADVDPGKLNTWLNSNSGYDGSLQIRWDKAAAYKGTNWLTFEGTGRISSLADLSRQLDNRKLIIAKSTRFSSHFVAIRGVTPDGTQGYYWDPYDTTATQRRIGGGWVNIGADTRVFRY